MSDSHHEWQVGSPPPLIRPHSVAKHRVIQQYLTRYVEVLTGNVMMRQFRLTLVDGFAGGGLYLDSLTKAERYGSPLLMLEAMREAAVAAQIKRSKEFLLDVDYVFVEASKANFAFLKGTLQTSQYRSLLDSKIHLVNDMFINQADRIIEHIKRRGKEPRAIFVLDQFGYPTEANSLRAIALVEFLTFVRNSMTKEQPDTDSTEAA